MSARQWPGWNVPEEWFGQIISLRPGQATTEMMEQSRGNKWLPEIYLWQMTTLPSWTCWCWGLWYIPSHQQTNSPSSGGWECGARWTIWWCIKIQVLCDCLLFLQVDEIHGHSHRSTSAVDGGWVVMAKHIRTVVFFVRKTALFFCWSADPGGPHAVLRWTGEMAFPARRWKISQ